MATLRPLFKTFLARSRLIKSSNRRASTLVWPPPNQPAGNNYFRGDSKNGNDDVEQLGLSHLRYNLPQGVGNSTIIQSLNDPRAGAEGREREQQKNGAMEEKILEAGDSNK